MFATGQWWQNQQTLLTMWSDLLAEKSHEYLTWMPMVCMGEHVHGLSLEQRKFFEELAGQYSDLLQKNLSMHLQHISLHAEIAERYMTWLHKSLGIQA